MPDNQWTAVDDYINNLFVGHDAALHNAQRASAGAGLPNIAVAPNQGKFLMLLARIRGARRILEIGTLGGYSTIWLARALPSNGILISLELEPKHAEVARANIAAAGFSDVVEVRVGPALDTLQQLVENHEPAFDFIFIDADKQGYPAYLAYALKLSSVGTLIVADNVVRSGEVANASSEDEKVQGVRKYNELLASAPGINSTIIQTVGSKGYDGFAISVVE